MMRRRFYYFSLGLLILSGSISRLARAEEGSFSYGRFGTVKTYQTVLKPKQVVLFISGDGGWNLGVVDMARALTQENSLVLGIDILHYFKMLRASKESCVYPASDFEALSKYAQKKFKFESYIRPIIVGYSSGATLAYVIAAEAPPNTFKGAVSLGFCSDLEVANPFCAGRGLKAKLLPKHDGWDFLPAKMLSTPWEVLHGTVDQVCSLESAQKFVSEVGNGALTALPRVGHGFSVQRNWMPQFIESFKRLISAPEKRQNTHAIDLEDLPLVEVPAEGAARDLFAVMISGDGGWASIDKEVSEEIARRGVPVVGLSSLEYFWHEKSEEKMGQDLSRIIQFYAQLYHKSSVLLIGYSIGADVLPFMTLGLPEDLKQKVKAVTLLGPSKKADFGFHLTDWVVDSEQADAKEILPVVNQQSLPFVCITGSEEADSLCKEQGLKHSKVTLLSGGHHFGGNYQELADKILENLK